MESILKEIIQSPGFVQDDAWKQRDFKSNEMIVEQGELAKSLFFIQQGVLRVTGNVELDEQKNIHPGFCDLQTGSIFGETCLYEESHRMATIIAVTDGCVIEIDGKKLNVFLDAHPVLGYHFYKQVFEISVSRLNKANQRVEHLMAWGLKVHEIDKYL